MAWIKRAEGKKFKMVNLMDANDQYDLSATSLVAAMAEGLSLLDYHIVEEGSEPKIYEVECPCGQVLEIEEGTTKECPNCYKELDDKGVVQ